MLEIEATGEVTKEFAKEIVNVMMQYRTLRNNPAARLKNFFTADLMMIIVTCVLAALLAAAAVFDKADGFMIACIVIVLFCLFYFISMLISMNRRVKEFVRSNSLGNTTMRFDEEGITYIKKDAQEIHASWDSISFIRFLDHSIIFFARDTAAISFFCSIRHKEELLGYIRENKIPVRMFGPAS